MHITCASHIMCIALCASHVAQHTVVREQINLMFVFETAETEDSKDEHQSSWAYPVCRLATTRKVLSISTMISIVASKHSLPAS